MNYTFYPVARISPQDRPILDERGSPILIISCSGFYLINQSFHQIHKPTTGLEAIHDLITVPGSSAGIIQYPVWKASFLEQLDMLIEIHDTHTIYIIDHQNCGLYKELYGSDEGPSSYENHAYNLFSLRNLIRYRHPEIDVLTYLVGNNSNIYWMQ